MRSTLLITVLAFPWWAMGQAPVPAQPPVPPVPPSRMVIPSGSYLGVGIQELTPERAKALKLREESGVEITRVAADSPAEKAGLKSGDVVLQINGIKVDGLEESSRLVRETPAGHEVKLEIFRNGATQTIMARVAERPPVPALPASLAPVAGALANAVNGVLANGDVKLSLKLPDTANVSIFRQIDSKWDVMADVQYTGWSTVQNLTIVRSTGAVLSTTPENFRDTWRASIGANYHYSDQWMFRGGLAFDQSPVRDAQRTPRLPDNDRTWISFGAQYKFSPQLLLDAGYTHIFVKDPSMNQNAGSTPTSGLISGTYKNNVNIVAAQVTYTFN